MSDSPGPDVGSIGWTDLTVDAAEEVRDFYGEVVGWNHDAVEMDGYSDFSMTTPTSGQTVAGICHARGNNAGLPPQWLIYINVADVEHSMQRCVELGGEILVPPRGGPEKARYCVIRDPAGAVAALFQPPG